MAMDGLGIDTSGGGLKDSRKLSKGKAAETSQQQQQISAATSYVVSKIDAGQAVLISDAVHCIEFPSILLPPGCTQGSVVSISCSRNAPEERRRADDFWDLQDDILAAFGEISPAPPALRLRNVTQTSVTLEWNKLELATSKLLSLTIWRNGQRLAAIPNPLNNTSTKVSGLEVDKDYSFHLMMRTTAGNFASQTIKTRTLTLTDTSGIAVCFGTVEPPELLEEAKEALSVMQARWSNRIQIETTHFVCTHPSNGATQSYRSTATQAAGGSDVPNSAIEYQRAMQLSIPVVAPSWVLSCLSERKMVNISAHPVTASSSAAQSQPMLSRGSSSRTSQQHQAQVPRNAPHPPIQLQNPPPPRKASVSSVSGAAAASNVGVKENVAATETTTKDNSISATPSQTEVVDRPRPESQPVVVPSVVAVQQVVNVDESANQDQRVSTPPQPSKQDTASVKPSFPRLQTQAEPETPSKERKELITAEEVPLPTEDSTELAKEPDDAELANASMEDVKL